MNKPDAQDASQSIAVAHAVKVEDPHLSREVEHRVHRAVHDHLREMVPDGATAVALDEVEVPKVVAVGRNHLYELTVEEIPEGRGPVQTNLRMRFIDPSDSSVDCLVKFSGHREDDRQVIRETVWRFRVADINLEFETLVNRQREGIDKDEKFALALAKAIGWEAPGGEVPLVAVA